MYASELLPERSPVAKRVMMAEADTDAPKSFCDAPDGTVLADSARYGVEKVICAGDVVGYGYNPVATIKILMERNVPTVMDNHDAVVAGGHDTGGMIDHARDTDAMHRAELGADDRSWLKTLPYVYEDENLAVAHVNFVNPQMMDYIFDALDARRSFIYRDERILFVGHTHQEALYGFGFALDSRFPDCHRTSPHDFQLAEGWRYLINVGSVGYPRVKPYSSYVLYDSATGNVCFRRVEFDFKGYVSALRTKSLPVPGWFTE